VPTNRLNLSGFFKGSILLALSGMGSSSLYAQSTVGELPVPIQRLLVKPAQVTKELEKVQQGTLIPWPLPKFDARLNQVRMAIQAREAKPRLVRAKYSADLVGASLTQGTGQWLVHYSGTSNALLPIDSLNLALAKLRWEKGNEALLGEFDGKSLHLLVKHSGAQNCYFDWSSRGLPGDDGLAFSLAVPPCPLTTFDLKLPADNWLTAVKSSVLVHGPLDAGAASHRLWKVHAGGQSQIELLVRKISEPSGPGPTVFARVQNVQKLERDRFTLSYEYQLDILHGSISELYLETDHALQPVDVAIKTGEVKRWQWIENNPKKDAKGKDIGPLGVLKIEFHQPVQGKLQGLRVRAIASVSESPEWGSPDLQVRGAIPRGETLQLEFPPDLPVAKWDAGTFQHIDISTDSDGRQTLVLADTAATVGSSQRPVLTLERTNTDVHTIEDYVWHITPRGATLHSDIHFHPTRGSLFELQVKLPKSFTKYQLQSMDLQPTDLLRGWHLQGDILIVELKQALVPPKKCLLKMQFRNPLPLLRSGMRTMAFPEVEPVNATRRSGTLTVRVDPVLHAQLMNSSLPPSAREIGGAEFDQPPPSFRFTFRDQRLTASVRVTARPIQLRTHGKHFVQLEEAQATFKSSWDIEPIVGEPEYLDFCGSAAFPMTWKLRDDESTLKVHHWERLHPQLLLFGTNAGLNAVLLQAMLPSGPCWRLHLSEPLSKKGKLTIEARVPTGLSADEWRRRALRMPNPHPWDRWAELLANDLLPRTGLAKHWHVPLLTPMHSGEIDHEIAVDAPNEPIEKVVTQGLQQVAMGSSPSPQAPLQSLSLFGVANSSPLEMALVTRTEKRALSPLESCDEAESTTFVHRDGRTEHRIRFRLWHGRDRTCTLGVPAGFQLIACKLQEHWLENIEIQDDPQGQTITLPVDRNLESVRYEVYLRVREGDSILPGMTRVSLPSIRWPVSPVSVKKKLCVAKDLLPLHHESLTPIGTPVRFAGSSASWQSARSLWTFGRSWWPVGDHAKRLEKLEQQRAAFLLAAAQFRANNTRPLTLAEGLELFALEYLKNTCPLVIDQTAFQSLGLCADTPILAAALTPQLGRPFWESLGLVYVPTLSGGLLTSPNRKHRLVIDSPQDIAVLEDALGEAVSDGQDASASFASVLFWLKTPASHACASANTKDFAISEFAGEFQDMTQWRVPDGDGAAHILVLDATAARLWGLIAAGLVAVVLIFVQRRLETITCVRTYLILLTCSLLMAIWLPTVAREIWVLPTIAVQWVAFVWALARLFSQRNPVNVSGASTVSKKVFGSAGVAALMLAAAIGVSAQPAAPRSYSVWILDGPNPTALLTPELIAKLDEWEKPAAALLNGSVLTAAQYVGTVKENTARFDAVYELHSTQEQATLILPLTGVQLQEQTLLDGAVVYPTIHKNGYMVPVQGKGAHQLRLSFTARVTASNEYLDLRFTIPKLVQNKLTMHWTKPVQAVHCLYCWGEDIRTIDTKSSVSKWEGQLGYGNLVHLRWTGSTLIPDSKAIEVKEAHFWDLRPDALSLQTSFDYAIGKNSVAQLDVALVDGLNVRAVEVLAVGQPPVLSSSTSIKTWQMKGKGSQRRLAIDFVQPISGNIRLNLEVVPQSISAQQQLSLPLPAPIKAKSVSGLLGYRLDATETRTTPQNLSVQEIKAADFDQEWKMLIPRSPVPSASRAYRFQRNAQQAGLKLGIQTSVRHAQLDLQWRVDLHHADFRGIFTITSPYEDLTFVEFAIDPTMNLADVLGPEVHRWSVRDSVLQVWLRSTGKQAVVELLGWKTHSAKIGPMAKRLFALPKIYPLRTQSFVGRISLNATPDMQMDAVQMLSLRPLIGEEDTYGIDALPYEGTFWLRTPVKTAKAVAYTKINRTEHGIEFAHVIRVCTERGNLPVLTVNAKNWPAEGLLFDAPGASIQKLKNKAAETISWSVKFPAGLPQEVNLTIRGRIANDRRTPISPPLIELIGIPHHSSFLFWKDLDCAQADTGAKIRHESGLETEIGRLPTPIGLQDLRAWNAAKAPGAVNVTAPKSVARPSGQILSSQESVQRDDRNRWIHTLNCWIHASESAELRLRFPAKVDHLSVLIDERMKPLRNPAAQEFTLPLQANPLPRYVQLRWTYSAISESPVAPNLKPIEFDWPSPAIYSHVLQIPPNLVTADKRNAAPPYLLERLLTIAATNSQLCAVLASNAVTPEDQPTSQILARQQDFFACLHQAEYTVLSLEGTGPNFEASVWRKRISALKRENADLAKEGHFERQRDLAEKAKPISAKSTPFRVPGVEGTPWKIEPGQPAPNLQLLEAEWHDECRTHTNWLLLIAVFVLVFTYVRHGVSLMNMLAPEIVLASILVYFWYEGIQLIGILAATLMVSIRCLRAIHAWRRLGAPTQATGTGNGASATKFQQTPPIAPLNS
jgi:hypothetical protein